MFAKLNNGQLEKYPYSLGQLRKDHRNVSFPKVPSDQDLARFGVVRVTTSPQPAYDYTKNLSLTAEEVNGQWVEKWVATDASQEEITERVEGQAQYIRVERNQLLSESDWTQVADAPVDQTAWAAYRRALRDITEQAGFPFNVAWPSKP